MSNVVGVDIDGVVEWHAIGAGGNDYNTLCGIDADDPSIGHNGVVKAKRGQKINCAQCYGIWIGVKNMSFRESDFDPRSKS